MAINVLTKDNMIVDKTPCLVEFTISLNRKIFVINIIHDYGMFGSINQQKSENICIERLLICHNEDASKKFVATEIFVFDFELFIGGRSPSTVTQNQAFLNQAKKP